MAEIEETRNCVRLRLSDGGHIYLQSVWQTTNFSIIVFDGFEAWFRCVSTKEVVSMARQWNIGVGEVIRSARARLSCEHPTSSYSMSAENDADVVNLSFTIDDLWEGEALDFSLRMETVSDLKVVVCEMLNNLADTNAKLKEQLAEAENELQKKFRQVAAVSEPEPSISLKFARSGGNNNNPRRQTSSFLEPRLLNFSKFKPVEGRSRTHEQHDTAKSASTWQPPSFNANDNGMAKPTTDSNLETEREVSYFNNRGAAHASHVNRNNDLTVNMVSLSPKIMQVLKSLSNSMDRCPNLLDCGDEELDVGAKDERGLKIPETRIPRREDQPQRTSVMRETNFVSTTLPAQALRREITNPVNSHADIARGSPRSVKETGTRDRALKRKESMISNTTFSGKKKIQEIHDDASGGHLEKCISSAGDHVKSKFAAEVEANGAGSDEERSSRATLEDAHLFRSAHYSRDKTGSPEQLFPRGPRLSEAESTEGKHETCQDPENVIAADTVSPESRASERQESPAVTTGKQSSAMLDRLCDKALMDMVATPSATKRGKVSESYTEGEGDAQIDEDEEVPVHPRQRNPCSRRPGVDHHGRKRRVEDRDESHGNRPVRSENDDFDLGGTAFAGRRTRRSSTVMDQDVMDLDDYQVLATAGKSKMKRGSVEKKQGGHFAGQTLATLIRLKRSGVDKAKPHHVKASFRPPEKKHRFGDRDEGSLYEEKIVFESSMPDADYYDFDKDRTEDLIKTNQIWAVYAENDEMPRSYARIDKVSIFPEFKATITWLKPHQSTEEAKQLSELSGWTTSCGEFEFGGRDILPEINCFSHRMVVAAASAEVMKIYPRKGEIWALFKNMANHNTAAGMSKGRFRVAAIVEDVEAGTRPKICVLGKVSGFRTVWKAQYDKGMLPTTDLSLFSHRVPAYRLHGQEVKGSVLHHCWDIDPAGLSPCDSQCDT